MVQAAAINASKRALSALRVDETSDRGEKAENWCDKGLWMRKLCNSSSMLVGLPARRKNLELVVSPMTCRNLGC